MANIDEVRRVVVLKEWIEELQTSRGVIENDSVEKTGLISVRNEILSRLEEILAYAESKMPGYDPMIAVASERSAPLHPTPFVERRRTDVGTRRKIYVHKRRGD